MIYVKAELSRIIYS